jgi:prepilin-type N-terminal cleavage/methylation domain-containing protein
MNSNIKRQKKGFTLLEILLVIAAIGILAAIVLVAINPNRQIAQVRNAQKRVDVNTIYKALEQYLIDNGSYPAGITTTLKGICNTGTEQLGGDTNCDDKVDLRVLVPTYIAGIPRDPEGSDYVVIISNSRVSVTPTINISTWTELAGITPNNSYKLTRDLTTSDVDYASIAGPTANGGVGWEPIETFSGIFKGNGYTIEGLFINRDNISGHNTGLFGSSNNATISDIKITNASISTGVGMCCTGILVGTATGGKIQDIYVSGIVRGGWQNGGLTGVASGVTLERISAHIDVAGSYAPAGVVGNLTGGSILRQSYVIGTVTGQFNSTGWVGGLVGNVSGSTVEDSYAQVEIISETNVSTAQRFGGFAGSNNNWGAVRRNYSASQLFFQTGPRTNTGAFVGLSAATTQNNYWDQTLQPAPGSATTLTSAQLQALTSAQMIGAAAALNMTALDFTNVWATVSQGVPINGYIPDRDAYPVLRNLDIRLQLEAQSLNN